ncbi:MAG: SH3 domain-containing protein [Bacteroidales bacterium]
MKKSIYLKSLILVITLAMPGFTSFAQAQKVKTTSACRLLSDPGNTRSVITYVPAGTELEVLATEDDYFLVSYDGSEGYISSAKVDRAGQPEPVQATTEPASQVGEVDYMSAEYQQARLEILIEKYGEKTGKALYAHKIWKGINHNMVRDSWGKPLEIKRSIKNGGITEIWVYPKTTLVLENDLLSSWGPTGGRE